MAIVKSFTCNVCGKYKEEAMPNDVYRNTCSMCLADKESKEYREFKAGREGLTVNERLRELEDFMYYHRKMNHYRGPIRF